MDFQEFKADFQKEKVEEVKNKVSSKPLVSICVQTYQHKKYIKKCLDSILEQKTNFDFEILLGEDHSKDGTREICEDYAQRFPEKIRLFLHHRENQIKIMGEPTSNFNALYNFYSARGKYIAFCEGDDAWNDPLKLQKQVDYLESHSNYSFTYHSYKTIDNTGSYILSDEEKIQPKLDIKSHDLKTCEYHPLLLTICFRNELRQIPAEMINVINVDSFLISLLGNLGEAKFLDKVEASLYRKHSGGIWSHRNKARKYLSKIMTYQKLMAYYNRIDEGLTAEFYRSKLQSTYKSMILLELKNVKPINAIKYLSRLRSL